MERSHVKALLAVMLILSTLFGCKAKTNTGNVGTTAKNTDTTTSAVEEIKVYVTYTGDKYHRADCYYLISRRELLLEQAVMIGYEPCKACNPPRMSAKNK